MGTKNNIRQKLMITLLLLPLLILSTQAFGQSTLGSVSGTVQDSTQAVLPGAVVTATNLSTGVKATAKANGAGVYNIAGLQPGVYKVTAEMSGFQTLTKTDIKLSANSQVRLDMALAVSGTATEVEVTSSMKNIILESSSSTGTVMGNEVVTELPLVGNNVMELANVMGGVVRPTGDSVFGNSTQTFAGVASTNVNIQRDGVTVSDVRYSSGIVSPSLINPEMVGEFKMILSPVDAELGRGAGQVQVLTKSGTNAFHGSGVWSNQNTGIDANEWDNNRQTPRVLPNYTNVNDYTISASGPIIKNKTFFFASWDQNIVLMRMLVRSQTLTNCARKGIYRWFSGWIPGNINQATSATTAAAGTQTRASVNADGTPLVPTTNRDGTSYSGTGNVPQYQGLNFQSVLGQLSPAATTQILSDPVNCSNYLPTGFSADASLATQQAANGITAGTNWDPLRSGVDKTGFISRYTALMPQGNDYNLGDGLNVNDLSWMRRVPGQDTVYGTGMQNQRKSITVKIDHNLNDKNRISGTWSYEKDQSGSAEEVWPKPSGYPGNNTRKPWTFTTSFTSTLSSTLLNEFRFGLAANEMHNVDPTQGPDGPAMNALLKQLLPTSGFPNWKDQVVAVGPGAGAISFTPDTTSMPFNIPPVPPNPASGASMSSPLGGRNDLEATWGDKDRRWTIGDTMTWAHGAHSFKGGAEVRLTRSQQDTNGWAQFTNSSNTYPYVQGGNTGITASDPRGITAAWAGMVGNNTGVSSTGTYLAAYNLMNYMAGSVGQIRQFYFVNDPKALSWNSPEKGEITRLIDLRQKEMSFFFKDDWKLSSDLTLNLGIRWDYFGVPYTGNGLTAGLVGGATSIFGGSQGGFGSWLKTPTYSASTETQQTFIGPNSPNPNQMVYNKDTNNFGPAVGFAWQIPWFGKGKTTMRGGYQATFTPIDQADPNGGYALVTSNVPGLIYPQVYSGDAAINSGYMSMADLPGLLPTNLIPSVIAQNIQPISKRPVTAVNTSSNITVYDPNIQNPYIQSLTLSLTRNIGSFLTADVRYIGTLSRKQIGSVNLNTPNFLNDGNGLLAAFDVARAGGESALLNSLILPGTLTSAAGASGSAQLRTAPSTSTNLSRGNYASLATTLANTNGVLPVSSTTRGGVLRASRTPENFIVANPQYGAASWRTNRNHSNYHSMQTQITMRPTRGLSFQASYTWSKNLGINSLTDPRNQNLDYGILSSDRRHNFTNYGTYTLPFGANGYFFRNSTGIVKKVVEGWQLSWTNYFSSGVPMSVTTQNSLWGGGQPDLVNPTVWNAVKGQVRWVNGARRGGYYNNSDGTAMFTQVIDPVCSSTAVAASLQTVCGQGLKGLAVRNADGTAGPLIFQAPKPGVRGNYDLNKLNAPGTYGLDIAASKAIQFMEGKSVSLRIDVQNVLNHPTPTGNTGANYNGRQYAVSSPLTNLNDTLNAFGVLNAKGGHRTFSAKLRISF